MQGGRILTTNGAQGLEANGFWIFDCSCVLDMGVPVKRGPHGTPNFGKPRILLGTELPAFHPALKRSRRPGLVAALRATAYS